MKGVRGKEEWATAELRCNRPLVRRWGRKGATYPHQRTKQLDQLLGICNFELLEELLLVAEANRRQQPWLPQVIRPSPGASQNPTTGSYQMLSSEAETCLELRQTPPE